MFRFVVSLICCVAFLSIADANGGRAFFLAAGDPGCAPAVASGQFIQQTQTFFQPAPQLVGTSVVGTNFIGAANVGFSNFGVGVGFNRSGIGGGFNNFGLGFRNRGFVGGVGIGNRGFIGNRGRIGNRFIR